MEEEFGDVRQTVGERIRQLPIWLRSVAVSAAIALAPTGLAAMSGSTPIRLGACFAAAFALTFAITIVTQLRAGVSLTDRGDYSDR